MLLNLGTTYQDIFPSLLLSDLHLTDNPRDEYRWELFDWAIDVCREHDIQTIFVLGDITDAKDNHSAKLVNSVVFAFSTLAIQTGAKIVILMGNHDYMVVKHPFFGFLNNVQNIYFIDEISKDMTKSVLLLPHTRSPSEDWKDLDLNDYKLVLMHQTVEGAIASNGMAMSGELKADFKIRSKVYSGDIHVPQRIGSVEYVGSPYHVHFGDRFKPRGVLLDSSLQASDLHFPTVEKFVATITQASDLDQLKIKEGDQLKIRVKITPSTFSLWEDIKGEVKKKCEELKVDLRGLEMITTSKKRIKLLSNDREVFKRSFEDAVRKFGNREKLSDDLISVGVEIAKGYE